MLCSHFLPVAFPIKSLLIRHTKANRDTCSDMGKLNWVLIADWANTILSKIFFTSLEV